MTQSEEQGAGELREAILADLRDRRLLKYLFSPEPEHAGAYGYVDQPLDLEVQHEIADTLARIVLAANTVGKVRA